MCAALREARQASGIGVRELGRLLGISDANISLWENCHRIPNVETVAMILTAVRVSPEERERILDLARNVREPNWLTVGIEGIPQQLAGVVECERAATSIVEWIPMGIPGLLQTSDYTRTIKESSGLPQEDIELRVMISAGRRDVITRVNNPVQFEALIDEAGLREQIGSPAIMVDQLRHLNAMGERPNVVIRVVPRGVGWHPGWVGPFILFEFPDSSPVVYFEHYSSGAFVPTEHDVAAYKKAINRLRGIARSPEESSALIAEIAHQMEAAP
ncbi:helix-turn-helix domain-containing protein [Gandjariella thermophila]|uniref:Transcriptional regulator n=1 Tax=Gandjariella thermophila TaxID=1931992 RepID=A0A4D4J9J8_9PSEU|nr:helix-turn-helix transcriptional regulator [Gandjariella thermophila]GDY33341.1 transcriptional regulator [Gandjariella thermophila]